MSNWLSIFKPSTESAATSPSPQSPVAGIKQDLADLGGAIAGHLRSAAAFLAPPPHSSNSSAVSPSLISPRKISSLLFVEGEAGDDVAGVTEEVLEYVQYIVSTKSHCWTDFPLSPNKDFILSHVQKKHASAVENLVADLKIFKYKMFSCMSEQKFWIIYFALLSPSLNEQDKELLITPEIEEAGAVIHNLANKKSLAEDPELSQEAFKTRGKSIIFCENELSDNSTYVKQEKERSGQKLENEPLKVTEDISSSDREDSDNYLSDRLARSKLSKLSRDSSCSDLNEWVRLRKGSKAEGGELRAFSGFREKNSEGEDSCGWLTVDEVDF